VEAATTSLDELLSRQERFDVITLWHVLEHFLKPHGRTQENKEPAWRPADIASSKHPIFIA